jgi:hypothetical protein
MTKRVIDSMPFRLRVLSAVFAAIAPGAPAAAQASPSQLAVFQDDGQLLHSGAPVRERTLDELQRLGVDVVKAQVYWHELAPGGTRRPPGFRGWDPASYAGERWARYDHFVQAVRARGMRVLLAPTGPAPGWATPKRDGEVGVWRPSAREFGRFVRALATRYDGRHADATGDPLPRVRFWTIWNEPNHPLFLQPLGSRSRHRAIAPHLYRDLVRFAVDGLRRAGHTRDSVLFGELLPIGHSRFGPRNTIKPITFIRELFCLDKSWRPYRGRAARARGCDGFRRLSGVTGFAIHPYSRPSGPRTPEPSALDATIGSLERIERALDRAAARGRVRRGLGIYNTEYGFQSDPPDPFQASLRRIPAYLNEAEWMTYHDRRVRTWSQYALRDDPLRDEPGRARYGGFQSGLYFADGERKDPVYGAWRLPIFVRLLGSRSVEVWGAARPRGSRGRTVRVEQRLRSHDYRRLGRPIEIRNWRGYFRKRFRISNASRRLFRFTYVTPDGRELASRSTRPARRRSP